MILNDLFESRMSELDIEYQDWLHSRGRGAIGDKEFQRSYGMTRRDWAIRNREWIANKQSRPKSPDDHLYPERQGFRPVTTANKTYMGEESQTDRNARIIAGEIEDAVENGDELTAKQKLKDLIKLGYYLDVNGNLQAMGMYEEVMENLRKWFKEKWVRFGPDGKIRGDCARGSDKEGKPKCLPQSKAHALGKKGRASAAAKKRREDPNPERRGPAKNVATKVREGAMKDLHTELADKYRELAPKIERHRDSYLAGELYDALEEIAVRHGAIAEFRRMLNGARNRAHMDYDTNPGGFHNWFWYLPFADEQLDEKQDACYRKVKSRYKVWPSAYASGALVQCRKKGAANWGNKSKK